jgi:membrane protein
MVPGMGLFHGTWTLIRKSVEAWFEDSAPSMGAALAYYTTFSLAPLLIIVIAVAGLVFGEEAARGEIMSQLAGLIGTNGAEAVQDLLASANRPRTGIVASVLGFAALGAGATSVLGELQNALDRIWRAPELTEPFSVLRVLRNRMLSLGVVVSMGFLLLVSLVIGAALSALAKWSGALLPGAVVAFQLLNTAVGFGVTTLLFAVAYRVLPRVKIAWRDVWTGAFVTAGLFTGGKYLIGLYLGRAGVDSGFGAAGSLVVILLWVYYSAQIFLLGAEFTWVYAHSHGSRVGKPIPPRTGHVMATPQPAT